MNMQSGLSITYYNSPDVSRFASSAPLDLDGKLELIVNKKTGEYLMSEEVLRLPFDANIFAETKRLAERYFTSQLKFVIVIGIGGSNLGTKALYDALRGPLDLMNTTKPKILFLDTTSATLLHEIEEVLALHVHYADEVLINIVSKSGTTTESIVNFELIIEHLKSHVEHIETRVVATTDHGSKLWKYAEANGYGLLAVPESVGGRFSVFSGVGLFPLLLAGIDVTQFREGASEMFTHCTSGDSTENHARRSAEVIFAAMQSGVSMLNIFHFNPELESLGKWERQLIAESLGKEKDLNGKTVNAGITPIVSIGSTDLHSMAQLYFGGPRDKFTMIIRAGEVTSRRVHLKTPTEALVPGISGRTPADIMESILVGVREAYQKNKLPYVDIRLPAVSAHAIGAYMEWRMATVLYLAALIHVNPFDQPNVEDYKKGAREALAVNSKS